MRQQLLRPFFRGRVKPSARFPCLESALDVGFDKRLCPGIADVYNQLKLLSSCGSYTARHMNATDYFNSVSFGCLNDFKFYQPLKRTITKVIVPGIFDRAIKTHVTAIVLFFFRL